MVFMDCKILEQVEKQIQVVIDYPLSEEIMRRLNEKFCVRDVGYGTYVVTLSETDTEELAEYLLKYPYIPKCYFLQQEDRIQAPILPQNSISVLEETGILKIQSSPLSLRGNGVIMGFLDTGIRYDLPCFLDASGKSRILAIWDQTINGLPPNGFNYGSLYTKEMIDEALLSDNPREIVPSYDIDGHGTKCASVACGSDNIADGNLGVAPECDIVMVKLRQTPYFLREYYQIPKDLICYSEPDILQALAFLQSFTKPFERPLITSVFFGTNMGNHSGDSILSGYINQMGAARNQVVVVAAGNEGNEGSHYHGEVILNKENHYVDIELLIGEGENGFVMELWGKKPDTFTIGLTSPAGEVIPEISYRVGRSFGYDLVYSQTQITVSYVVVEQGTGEELILIRMETPKAGLWTIRVFAKGEAGIGVFDLWLPSKQLLRGDTRFLRPDSGTTITAPAYGKVPITVAAYDNNNNGYYINGGRGYASDGGIKPDLMAPGVNINTVLGKESGTSIAAAFLAGACADFMQWAVVEKNDIFVNTLSMKNYLIRGARRDRDLEYPSPILGYGKLDMRGVFDQIAGVNK